MALEPALLSAGDLADGAAAVVLDDAGAPVLPLALVDLDRLGSAATVEAALAALTRPHRVLVGVTARTWSARTSPLAEALANTLAMALDCSMIPTPEGPVGGGPGPLPWIDVTDPHEDAQTLAATVGTAPRAALILADLLRLVPGLDVPEALQAESLAYSTLLGGPEFAAWRASAPARPAVKAEQPAVLVARDGDRLRLTLNRPERHNAFDRAVRDGLVQALTLAELDDTVTAVTLDGNGPSFCSGGDLDEFGTTPDVATAHLIRRHHSAGLAVHRVARLVTAQLHGACIGAGIEVPAFAGRVHARPGTYVQLPELRLGLVPGAGGTVSLTRRIGRWRTAYLALSGRPLDVVTARRWGLVDAIV